MTAVIVRSGTASNLVTEGPAPASHRVTKSNGETVTARWSVRNRGDAPTQAQMGMSVVGIGEVRLSSPVTINPGQAVRLSVSWLAQGLSPGDQEAGVFVQEFNGAGFGVHIFTIAAPVPPPPPPPPAPPPTGGILEALDDLTIF